MSERCTWCGEAVDETSGYRAYEPAGSRRATFCRLEHVVPWAIRGAMWEPGPAALPDGDGLTGCVCCGAAVEVVLVRSRGEHRVPDGFCTVAHLLDWAKAGGRYA